LKWRKYGKETKNSWKIEARKVCQGKNVARK
jgi:hypothetical protein